MRTTSLAARGTARAAAITITAITAITAVGLTVTTLGAPAGAAAGHRRSADRPNPRDHPPEHLADLSVREPTGARERRNGRKD